ncbi:ABC transporter B family member 15-like [Magnolia sinica]|uniref:ABC transporter B family member 15-like n=1 Tax=Magnolia sinica TaxID=86752 RepID=UPI0026581D1B|nr:ABC transporter B family member 15-like [Magnolia sinica]
MEKAESGSVFQLFRFADRMDKWLMLVGTVGCIGDGLMTPLTLWVMSTIINSYGAVDVSFNYDVVNRFALRLLYVAIGVGLGAFVEGVCWTRTAERQTSRMRMEYLQSVLRQDVGFFDTNATTSTTYDVVTAITADSHIIQDVMSDKIPNFISNAVIFIFTTVVALILSWRLALASLPFCLFFIIPGVVFGKFMMDMAMLMKDAYGVAGGIAEQAISSIRTVVSYVGESQTLEQFSHALVRNMELGIKQGLMKGMAIGSIGILFAMWSFQSWVASVLVTETGAKGGSVFISGLSILYGGLAVLTALPNLTYIAGATAAATRIFKMIDRLPAIDSEDERGMVLENLRGEIEFRNVEFTYPSRPDSSVLQGLNLRVMPGKTVGLVGGSGSGKSTVIALLERFYDPVSGDIYLDRKNIKRFQLKWLRSQMGLVSQEPVLFATSIKENIQFGNEAASMELVVSAAKAANAHDFITKLPDGYFTHVGQFGVQMSGGQKQRIAIARALLKDPRILLLDEATSALDAQSERVVQDALDQASIGRTTIIIAHRLATLRKADTIAVVQSGKVIESGSHDQLMRMNNGGGGEYAKMVQMQQSTMKSEAYKPSPMHDRNKYRNMYMKSPMSVRSSNHTSPAVSFVHMGSPALSFVQASTPIISSYVRDQHLSDLKEAVSKNSSSPSQWRLLRMNAPEWKTALLGCLGAIAFGAAQPVHFYCIGSILSVYFLDDNKRIKSQTRLYCYLFLGIGLFCVVANVIQHYYFAIMGEGLTKRVREKMLEKLLTFEIGWFDREENTSAAICARLAAEANMVRSLVGDRISLLLQVTATATLSFTLGIVVTWRLGAVMIAMQPLIIGCFYSRSVLMQKMSERAQKAQNEGSQIASEAVVNHRTITAFSSQGRVMGLYENALEGPRKENIKQSWLAGLGLFVSQFATTASVALAYWYGGKLMIQGKITPKHLFQAFFILVSTGKVIADAGTMTSDLSKGSGAIRSVFEVLDRKSEIEPNDPQGLKIKKMIKGHVELKNVHFAYPSRPDQMIFRGLSCKIEAGKQVALVGQSGSGKSTIIGLIERFYDPLKGSVEIDGQDIKSYNLRSLRMHIALVSQEPTLFAGTIRENIAYGRENATESEIMEAAVRANAHDFISSMKDGYETYCGERGTQLSGGQKQRIALARAILKNPAILLLDEATSALDTVSESLVQGALDRMMVGRTCVIVAHRLSTIQKSESIAVIKNGKIVEQGSHSKLLAKGPGGAYFALIKLQKDNNKA